MELSEDGGHRTGVDFGTSTIATVSNDEVHLEELAPESARYEKTIRHKQNLVDVSMRKHNPENYNKNGTVKKAAFLICHTDDTLTAPDFETCHLDFPHFVKMQDTLILNKKKCGHTMKHCFGF